ncbi:HAD family hydrolase [Ostreibacterium oceani]|uniref:HAD-IA family hydrolase n=1 Tax=Ostreibacterium oceani TaxID=2654998 RepID=A0A6N7EXG6_9GAMM|nr:HAD family phosphatase [Ostreibacterium oceani]MPV86240.1 HAD-IA family hydrolase [Ostreibacterium oceani]
MMHDVSAVIFDMDGVIFDSEQVYYDAFFIVAKEHGLMATDAMVREFAGKSKSGCQLILQNLLDNDLEKTQQFWQDWGRARDALLHDNGMPFKSGFVELLQSITATNRDVAIVTSAERADLEDNFRRTNTTLLDTFKHIVTIEAVKQPKPHPEPYDKAMRYLGYAPENCVVIEDSIPGVSAALAANAQTIMINDYMQPEPSLRARLLHYATHHQDILQFMQTNGL